MEVVVHAFHGGGEELVARGVFGGGIAFVAEALPASFGFVDFDLEFRVDGHDAMCSSMFIVFRI